jgi:hypothetical protein
MICIRKIIITTKKQRMKRCDINITNLAFHDLIMEIMQNLFIYNLYVSCIDIMHWKHIWHTDLLKDAKSVWHLFIHRFILHFICQHIYSCVKRVFNAWCLCVKSMNLWMNELHMIFNVNLSCAKFVMMTIKWKNFITNINDKKRTYFKILGGKEKLELISMW